MDLWSVHVKNTINWGPFLLKNSIPEKPIFSWSLRSTMMGGTSSGNWGILEIRVSKRRPYGHQSFVVGAMGKKNNNSSDSQNSSSSSPSSSSGNGNQSSSEGNNQKGSNPSDSNKSKDIGSQRSHCKPLDWREVRAGLYIQEQAEIAVSDTQKQDQITVGPKTLPLKWAHPISTPENGCLLVATEKLDGVRTFERTVVLLLRSGTRHPQEGPFGIVMNHPLHKKIKHMKPTNLDLQTTFAECSLHFGGPLEASMFLMRAVESSLHGFEEVIPGVCFGARNSLEDASALVKKGMLKPHDFRFFVGYAGWQLDQLREEIESDYWLIMTKNEELEAATGFTHPLVDNGKNEYLDVLLFGNTSVNTYFGADSVKNVWLTLVPASIPHPSEPNAGGQKIEKGDPRTPEAVGVQKMHRLIVSNVFAAAFLLIHLSVLLLLWC